MKIAIVKETIKGSSKTLAFPKGQINLSGAPVSIDDPRVKDCYNIYETEQKIKDEIKKKKYNKWVDYTIPYALNKVIQRRYEDFCSGFLYYYEKEIRNGFVDHTIYFEWEIEKKQAKVTVWITPYAKHGKTKLGGPAAPGMQASDPPRPPGPPPPGMG